ncbi:MULTISPECIES: tetratricopeptide repeat protein [unclassified Pseudoxanthomonas]|uniref:tetratricopeptide repeat protein n=1 Tax=unclassified Pseudoxanthomonas TaxID=2645906 RepID=UPI0030779216
MGLFAALAALLTVAVLAGVLWPLWRDSRGLVFGTLMALGIATFALYRVVGAPDALDPAAKAMPTTLEEAVAQLEAELKKHPNEPEGWRLLGKSYTAQERYPEARAAFDRAIKLMPDNADLLVEAAQARMFADPQRRLGSDEVTLLYRALAIEPNHQRARWFLGVSQRQNDQPAEAAKTWEPLLAQVDANTATTLRTQINTARSEAGLPPLPEAPAAAPSPALLTVVVDIAPVLKARLSAGDVLFVFARQAGGPPMPVAAKRVPATEFPITVALSDSDSPMPTMKLSQTGNVELVARISKAGDVTAKPGDLEAAPLKAEVRPGAEYSLRIDQIVE